MISESFPNALVPAVSTTAAHLKEPGCAVTAAVERGEISRSRYRSYVRLYELTAQHKAWEIKQN